jgi:hypothetical protein
MRRAANSYLEHEYEYQESLSAVGTTGKPPSARHWRADGAHRLFRFPGPPRCGSNAVHHARRTEQGQGAQEAATGMTACMRPAHQSRKARRGACRAGGRRGRPRLFEAVVCGANYYAESAAVSIDAPPKHAVGALHNYRAFPTSLNIAISLSGTLNLPRLRVGGIPMARASSFSVGSARR